MKPAAKKAKAKAQKGMSSEAFAELELSLNQALAYERGERQGFRVTDKPIPLPPKPRTKAGIMNLRQKLQCSQSVFAQLLNVSVKTVQAWEQGVRKPSDAALKLLAIAEKYPEALFDSE
jgi:putative transcriptional regulator